MSNETFGFDEPPFADLNHPRFLFPSRSHRQAVACLRGAIEAREPFALLTGLPGVGKTVAVETALAGAAPHVRVTITATLSMTREEFRERVLDGFAPAPTDPAPSGGGLDARLRAVAATGHAAVLVVDQAQDLSSTLLDDLRLYSNLEAEGHALLQIVLVGRPALEAVLTGPGSEALRQRIAAGCRLEPLTEEETAGYVHHRVAAVGGDGATLFATEACATLHRLAHGIPREIGQLATEALSLAGTAGETQVTAGHVTFAVMMLGFRSVGSDAPAPSALVQPQVEAAPAPAGTAATVEAPEPPTAAEDTGLTEWTLTLQDLAVPQDMALPEDAVALEQAIAREPVAASEPAVAPGPAAASEPTVAPEPAIAPEEWTTPLEETTVTDAVIGAALVEPCPAPVCHAPVEEPVARLEPAPAATVEVAADPVADVAAGTNAPATESPAPTASAPRQARPRRRAAPGERPKRGRRVSPTAALSAAALLLVAVVGLVIGHTTRRRVQAPPSTTVALTTPAEHEAAPAPSHSPVARPASATHRITPAPPARSLPRATPAAETGRKVAPTGRACAVEVATFLSESRAQTERERLAAALQMPCQVVPAGDDGYAVVVGPVADARQAERLSTELSRSGQVNQARVVRWKAPGDSGR